MNVLQPGTSGTSCRRQNWCTDVKEVAQHLEGMGLSQQTWWPWTCPIWAVPQCMLSMWSPAMQTFHTLMRSMLQSASPAVRYRTCLRKSASWIKDETREARQLCQGGFDAEGHEHMQSLHSVVREHPLSSYFGGTMKFMGHERMDYKLLQHSSMCRASTWWAFGISWQGMNAWTLDCST